MNLRIQVTNVYEEPLDDFADLDVVAVRTDRTVKSAKNFSTLEPVIVPELSSGDYYKIKVFPRRYRPVGRFIRAGAHNDRTLAIPCPVDPERVTAVEFPTFGQLDANLQHLLDSSNVETELEAMRKGEEEFQRLGSLQKAGLLNLYAKMSYTMLPDGSPVSAHVESLYRIRGDRIFGNVTRPLRDLVKTSVLRGLFEKVEGLLHRPPEGFELSDSFKTDDPYGNLQLTFFASKEAPPKFRVDADIDDANGLGHLFQVLGHWIGGKSTHPYDIHEILVYSQEIDPGYRLVV